METYRCYSYIGCTCHISSCNLFQTKEDFEMENEVMEKGVLFQQNLRCENVKRGTLVHLADCKREENAEELFVLGIRS